MSTQSDLAKSIYTGFIDYREISLAEYHPRLLINNNKRGQKVLTNIISELSKCDEFLFSVAFVTNSGVASLINMLKELEGKGVKGKIIASQYQNFTEPKALERLLQLKNVEVKIVVENNFHAKGYIFKKNDTYTLIVGSSNLTQDALSYNKEWNIKVSSMKEGSLLRETIDEFNYTFENAVVVDAAWISGYQKIYDATKSREFTSVDKQFINNGDPSINAVNYSSEDCSYVANGELNLIPADYEIERSTVQAISDIAHMSIYRVMPNKMQIEALTCIESLRNDGKRKALLISATGTGKTYLSAFDVKKFKPRRFLFVVHRENIARTAMKSFQKVLGQEFSMGVLSGYSKDYEAEYLFCTIQTLSKEEVMARFRPDCFDYIVIDEVHRSGAGSYQKVLEYFKPQFLLGMSATPERMDGFDIFKAFEYNIAYEIRLNRALEENMLCTFHYYGVSEIEVEGQLLNEQTAFNSLVCNERVDRIIEKARLYGCDHGRVKGLVFCNRVEESNELSKLFNVRGYKTIALDGKSCEEERERAIIRLEQDNDLASSLDYIFTVDIFNEGVDIPSVNQIIMLRPTQSSIVFIQQLGRGLRKRQGKEYLVIIDFIGNYNNNFLIPIALYGDNSYNKDNLRKLINSGNSIMPGSSTINFDYITKQRIFESINTAKMNAKKDLVNEYKLLKYKLGRIPTMMDFLEHGSRDPYVFVEYSSSYFSFVSNIESVLTNELSLKQKAFLEFYSKEIGKGKRIEDIILIQELLKKSSVHIEDFKEEFYKQYTFYPSNETIRSCIRSLNCHFNSGQDKEKYKSLTSLKEQDNIITLDTCIKNELTNAIFKRFLTDVLDYAKFSFNKDYCKENYIGGFLLYQKYSRKDVCRILNWEKDESSTVYGYRIKNNTCPVFVTYDKKEDISESTKYEDKFISSQQFSWMTRGRVKMDSKEIADIQNFKSSGLRILLFVKKSDSEGTEFYYMGDMMPFDFIETKIKNNNGAELPVVNIQYQMLQPIEEKLMAYLSM